MIIQIKMKLLIASILNVATLVAHAEQVIGIVDGDTLKILQNKTPLRIRLANIDAPEKKQPFGQVSRQSLSDLCFHKDATIQLRTIDRYNRPIAIVICNGVEANKAQVERGMAWVYTKYNKDTSLPQLEKQAKEQRLGLWLDPDPMPPWEWRKSKN